MLTGEDDSDVEIDVMSHRVGLGIGQKQGTTERYIADLNFESNSSLTECGLEKRT